MDGLDLGDRVGGGSKALFWGDLGGGVGLREGPEAGEGFGSSSGGCDCGSDWKRLGWFGLRCLN